MPGLVTRFIRLLTKAVATGVGSHWSFIGFKLSGAEGIALRVGLGADPCTDYTAKPGSMAKTVDKNWRHVAQITGRKVILVRGEIVFAGRSSELHARPELRQQYLGD